MVDCELVFLVGRGEGNEGYKRRLLRQSAGGEREGSERRRRRSGNLGRLRDVSWRKILRYSALVEADSRRETLAKDRRQTLCHIR